MGLMTPQWSKETTPKQFLDKLDERETDLDMYQKQTSKFTGDSIKVAVISKHAPIYDDYDALRTTV